MSFAWALAGASNKDATPLTLSRSWREGERLVGLVRRVDSDGSGVARSGRLLRTVRPCFGIRPPGIEHCPGELAEQDDEDSDANKYVDDGEDFAEIGFGGEVAVADCRSCSYAEIKGVDPRPPSTP